MCDFFKEISDRNEEPNLVADEEIEFFEYMNGKNDIEDLDDDQKTTR